MTQHRYRRLEGLGTGTLVVGGKINRFYGFLRLSSLVEPLRFSFDTGWSFVQDTPQSHLYCRSRRSCWFTALDPRYDAFTIAKPTTVDQPSRFGCEFVWAPSLSENENKVVWQDISLALHCGWTLCGCTLFRGLRYVLILAGCAELG